jgi:hypothetical protein
MEKGKKICTISKRKRTKRQTMIHKINTMKATGGAGSSYPSGAPV